MAIQSKFFVVLIVTLVILLNMGVNADVPHLISYQGRILDSRTGEPVPDGLYDFTFRLYGDEFTDYAFWTEIHQSVQVSNGLYNIILGSVTPFGNFDFSTQYWLGVQVGMDDEMTPRYQLSASPYALSIADDAITTQKIQDGTITQDDLHGRLVFAEIVDEEGEYKFALTKHNPKLQIIGNVEFDEENHAIAISGGNSNNGGKGSEWTRSGTIVHLTNSGDSVGIGTSNPSYQLDVTDEIGIGEASTATGKIHFRNSTSGTEVTIQSGVTTSDYSLTLPTSQGDTGYVIVNDGAGNLSWSELNDSDWVYLPDSSYMYAKKSAGSNTYARIYDSGESQVLDVLHPINSHGEYAIRGRSDSTGAYGVLGYFDSLYGGFGVLGEAGPDGVVGVAGICSTNIGALGTDGEGVYGQGDKIGGNFTPTVRIVPQDSVPINTDGALYVKNNGIDTLYFNDDSTGWVPILTGPHGLQEAYESGNNVEMSVVSGDIRMFIPAPPLPPGLPPIDLLFLDASSGYVGIGDTTPSYKLDVSGEIGLGVASESAGKIHFRNSTSATEVTIQSGITDSSYTIILPTNQGDAEQVMKNDGSGNLSWADLNDGDWTVNPLENYIFATQADSLTSYVRIYDKNQSQTMDVSHPTKADGQYAIKGLSDSTGAFGILGYFDTSYGGYGVFGDAGSNGFVGVAGVKSNNIGALGTDSEGVYGEGDEVGGKFLPAISIVPQDSQPGNLNGGLYVKNAAIDTLYFYDDTTGWVPVLVGPFGLQEAYNDGDEIELTPSKGDIRIYGTSPYAELLYLNASNGYVGIGDTTPSYKLDVDGKGRFTDSLTI
ncbi:hypothetical protein JXI42_02495, partial [bacterium]|nr:hypothetical protein [bacterium]